ncbi:MAG: hypothetical protein ABIS36_10270 [Chryseolinea sp.]
MKMKSLYVAALMVMAAAVSVNAKDEPGAQGMAVVAVKGSDVFKVIYKGETASKVKLNVYDASSQIVFSETMGSVSGFIRPLNFKGLQFGEYTIELTDASGTKTEKVSFMPTKSSANIHVSRIKSTEDKFLLSVANSSNETITVKIFDSSNNLIHVDSRETTGDFAQLYSLKDIKGAVSFEISDNAGNYRTAQF